MPQFSIDILIELGNQSHFCCWSARAGDHAQYFGPKGLEDGDGVYAFLSERDMNGHRYLVGWWADLRCSYWVQLD